MEKYWKLLNIEDGEYSVHETEEEVNHIIEYRTRDFSDDKVTKRINIKTPFSNYDFQFVYVFDEHHIHQFLYFFDTIEEERDDFEERIMILQTHRDTDVDIARRAYEVEYMNGKENLNALFGMRVTDIVRELIEYDNKGGWVKPDKMSDAQFKAFVSNQLYKENNKKSRFLYYLWSVFCTAYIYSDTDSVKILDAFEAMESCLKDEIVNLSNQLDEITKQRDNAINILNKKTTDLFNANRTIDYLRKHNSELKELINKINDLTHPF